MKFSKVILLFCTSIGIFAGTNPASAGGCALEGVILKCNHEAKTAAAIIKAFASEETREILTNPLSQKERFQNNGDLEKYRVSMEKNWRVIVRLAKRQERNKSRGRISEADFQEWSRTFVEAEKSYAVALNFYRQLNWQDVK